MDPLLKKRDVRILVAILLAGCILRIIFFIQFRNTPFYDHPTLDARYYDQLGQSVASGKLIQDRAFFMGPLYPYTLGFQYALFGHSKVIPRMMQMLYGLGCCLFLYLIGRRLFSRSVGLFAAFLYALYKPSLFYEQTLLSETPMALVCLILVFLMTGKQRKPLYWLGVGGALGIAALFRGNVLLFAPVLAVWLAFCSFRDTGKIFDKAGVLREVMLVLGVLIGIAPATVHNYLAERDFVLITSNAGFNFFIGNQAKASGRFVMPPRVDMDQDPSGRRIAEQDLGRSPLKSSEVSKYWSSRARRFIHENRGGFIKLLGLKFRYFWGRTEIAQIYSMKMIRSLMPVLKWPLNGFFLVGPLAVVGMILCLIRRERNRILLVLFVLVYAFSLLPFFMTARYRIPIIPILCLFAGHTVIFLVSEIKKRCWKPHGIRVAGCLIGAVILFFLMSTAHFIPEGAEASQFHNALGLIYQKDGNTEQAIESYHKAILARPSSYAFANLGTLYYEKREYKEALGFYRKALEMEPDNARMHFNLGQALLSTRDLEGAREAFEKAVSLDRRVHPLAHYNLAVLYARKGEREKALGSLENYLSMHPGDRVVKKTIDHILRTYAK